MSVDKTAGDFGEFWYRFPRRVGKLAAEKAYQKALRGATHEEIMAGVERYIRTKPSYADWCHPRTFLSQGRWMDEADDTRPIPWLEGRAYEVWNCPHTPRCPHRTACWVVSQRKVTA